MYIVLFLHPLLLLSSFFTLDFNKINEELLEKNLQDSINILNLKA
jgi:hypothetical protein